MVQNSFATFDMNHSNIKDKDKYYFFGALADYILAGGLSIVFYFIAYAFFRENTPRWIYALSGILLWVGNWPHFAATSIRLYGSSDTIKQYPLTASLVPILVLAGMIFSFTYPEVVAPYFIKVFLIWSPYHFSGQTIGVTLIYARRAGYLFSNFERKALSCFVFGTYLLATVRSETYAGNFTYYDIPYPSFGLPSWSPNIVEPFMWGGFILLVLSFIQKSRKNNWVYPLIILVPSLAQFVWFVLGSNIRGFTEFVPFFHSVQYLLVASSMQIIEQAEKPKKIITKQILSYKMVAWILGIVCVGSIMFHFLPKALEAYGIPLYLALGVSGAAVQIHHFFVDGVIWKLKRKTVSQPLMQNAKRVFQSLPTS